MVRHIIAPHKGLFLRQRSMGSSHSMQRLKASDGQVDKSNDLRLKSKPWLSKEYALKKGCDSLTGDVYASPFVTTNAETDPRTPPSALV